MLVEKGAIGCDIQELGVFKLSNGECRKVGVLGSFCFLACWQSQSANLFSSGWRARLGLERVQTAVQNDVLVRRHFRVIWLLDFRVLHGCS